MASGAPRADPGGDWAIRRARDLGSGQAYGGRVTVREEGDAWHVSWSTSIGDFQGEGLLVGRRLWVAWSVSGGEGLALYHLGRDGVLDGVWIEEGGGGVLGQDSATGAGRRLAGSRRIHGTHPDGRSYDGLLSVRREGWRRYRFTWLVEGQLLQGVGLRWGRTVGVAWGRGDEGIAAYRLCRRRARGRWAVPEQRGLGREDWER